MSPHPDATRSRLRAMVAEVDVAIGHPDGESMRPAWQRLVAALNLGPEPTVRNCPRCGELGMSAATRCGHCWAALMPV
jgi:hypothetical protein